MLRDTASLLLLLTCVALFPSCTNHNSAPGRETAAESSNSPFGSTKSPPEENKAPVPRNLEELEQRFVLVIRARNAKSFLGFVSDGGMYLGVDAEKSSKKAIVDQIGAKKGIYCLLFETACLRAETRQEQCSYSQLLSASDEVHTSTTLGTFDHHAQAEITVIVRNYNCNSGPESLNFVFNHEPSGWRLVAIPYT